MASNRLAVASALLALVVPSAAAHAAGTPNAPRPPAAARPAPARPATGGAARVPYGTLWQNAPELKSLGLFSKPHSSGLCGPTCAVNLMTKLQREQHVPSGFPDAAHQLAYLVTHVAPSVGITGAKNGTTSNGLAKVLNAYFADPSRGIPGTARVIQGAALRPSDFAATNRSGGLIIKKQRYDGVTSADQIGAAPANGTHFLLATSYEAPNRVAFLDPERKDGRARMATLVPVKLGDGTSRLEIKFDDAPNDTRVHLVGNAIAVSLRRSDGH